MSIATNNSNSILSPENISLESVGLGSSPTTDSSSGFFDGIKNTSFLTWVIIILILSFLGFNIFAYLAKGTQNITNILQPFVGVFGNIIRTLTGKTLEYAGEGGTAIVNASSNIANAGLNQVTQLGEIIDPTDSTSSLNGGQLSNTQQQPQAQPDNVTNSALNKAINTAQTRQNQNQNQNQPNDYEADEANSSIQGGGKSGWCYIGEDRGFRSCALVGVNDTCVSGDIFPTKQLCVNPNLRT